VKFKNESGNNIGDWNLKVFNKTLMLFHKDCLSSHDIIRFKFCSALYKIDELRNIKDCATLDHMIYDMILYLLIAIGFLPGESDRSSCTEIR
jgi:hypothetical protein